MRQEIALVAGETANSHPLSGYRIETLIEKAETLPVPRSQVSGNQPCSYQIGVGILKEHLRVVVLLARLPSPVRVRKKFHLDLSSENIGLSGPRFAAALPWVPSLARPNPENSPTSRRPTCSILPQIRCGQHGGKFRRGDSDDERCCPGPSLPHLPASECRPSGGATGQVQSSTCRLSSSQFREALRDCS
jgi:hypothetical protein